MILYMIIFIMYKMLIYIHVETNLPYSKFKNIKHFRSALFSVSMWMQGMSSKQELGLQQTSVADSEGGGCRGDIVTLKTHGKRINLKFLKRRSVFKVKVKIYAVKWKAMSQGMHMIYEKHTGTVVERFIPHSILSPSKTTI